MTDALVADDAELAARVDALGSPVGVDTEFMRVRTFFPIPALYQLGGENGVTLVDAQAPATFDALKALLADGERVKVMHACSEDLEVIARQFALRPANLVDTQLAHAFLTPQFSASYAALVEHYLGVALQKHETRSDWLQRPLTAQQIDYACEDAAYLRGIWERQHRVLLGKGRLPWFNAEMASVLAKPALEPEESYRAVGGLWRLSERELGALRSLAAWRERHARRRDLPRTWIVRDPVLLTMAQREALTEDDLASLLPQRAAKRFAPALLEAHRQGIADPNPPSRPPKPLSRAGNAVVKKMQAVVRGCAEQLEMAPELLARRRDLVGAYRCFQERGALPGHFDGWRADILHDALAKVLAEA